MDPNTLQNKVDDNEVREGCTVLVSDGGKIDDNEVREGSTVIVSGGGKVFYNPVQEFNRDLSISVINTYFQRVLKERSTKKKQRASSEINSERKSEENSDGKSEGNSENKEIIYEPGKKYEDGMVILEALAATGLRSIRYAKEIAGVKRIIANDLSGEAVKAINNNVKHNAVEHLVESSHSDAMTLMYLSTSHDKNFDVIDLDPYGSPTRFLDGALQSIANGGLLLVTATDMAVLAGTLPEIGFVKYGTVPLRMKCCHEMALRILLYSIETTANRYGKYIEPLISLSIDFYVRVFVRVYSGPSNCKFSMSKHSIIYNCTGCDTFTLHPLGISKPNPTENNPKRMKLSISTGPPVGNHCSHCKHPHHVGGPIWSAPIHDVAFVKEILDGINAGKFVFEFQTLKRIYGMLTVVHEELNDVPLYYSIDKLCNVLKLEIVPMLKFRSALLYAGYRVSSSHALKMSIKTDAPSHVIWDLLRCWNKRYPVKEKRLKDGTPVKEILSKTCESDYDFDSIHPAANPDSRIRKLTRYQVNPKPYWGPGRRASKKLGNFKEIYPTILVSETVKNS